ncbi:NADP-dependent oxidoreductase [Actinomadura decatromicini]|uniref:NADP-dependent oxidoreductase n=1 Tax=Actinomadura decatromicini TaxID=2604572 RepID=A0A5D3FME4_9ACTN|nr:NADP-dependent oxidoreductase [Actinomadura decatromicini]TYK49481.1 NADP-dependent oxidoreductase [Actinomadura decatromicini]
MAESGRRQAREWHLVRRPEGRLSADDLALVEAPVPDLEPGQVLVRNTHLSVDPYMRGRMDDRPSYIPPFPLNAPLDGGAVGVVAESRADGVEPGRVVTHFRGLREVAVLDADGVTPVDPDGLPPEVFLSALGGTGLTAWLGITRVAEVRPGDTVFVTGAAGAVGGIAGQLARLRGAKRVIGSAGSPAKVRHLVDELGFDAAFDYHDGPVGDHLAEAAPDGLDVVFDNVGGVQLEAAIDHLRIGARLALCGAAGQYDDREPYGPRNLYNLTTKRATARGFLVSDHADQAPAFYSEVAPWIRSGEIVDRRTVLDGIERVPEGLLGLLRSGAPTVGKVVVRVAGEDA